MRQRGMLVATAAAVLIVPAAARAQPLTIAEVSAPAINCVFQTDCVIPVTDTTGNLLLPFLAPGTAWLQSIKPIVRVGMDIWRLHGQLS